MRKAQVRVMQLPSRGQVTLPREFRERLGLEEGDLIQMRLVDGRIEITPVATEQHQRQYTDAEVASFLEEDKIDEETAAAVRRMLADGAL